MARKMGWLLLAWVGACASLPVGSVDSRETGIGAGLLRTGGLLLRTSVQAAGRVGQAVWADVRTLRVQVRDARKLHESTLQRTDLEAGGGTIGFDSLFPGNVIVQVSLGGSAGEEVGSASSTVEVQPGLVTQAELSVRLKPTVLVAGSLEARLKVLEGEEILVSGGSSPAHGASGRSSASLVHAYHRVGDAEASRYLVDHSGLRLYEEAWGRPEDPLTYWGPTSPTAPAIVTYRYDFAPSRLERGSLTVRTSTWDYTTGTICCGSGKGSVVIEASMDGVVWTPWYRTEPVGKVEDGYRELSVPRSFDEASAFWVRLIMRSTVAGGYANAQVARAAAVEERHGYRFEAVLH